MCVYTVLSAAFDCEINYIYRLYCISANKTLLARVVRRTLLPHCVGKRCSDSCKSNRGNYQPYKVIYTSSRSERRHFAEQPTEVR